MFYEFTALALVVFAAEIAATIKNQDIWVSLNPSVSWISCYKLRWLLGFGMSVLSLFSQYTLAGDEQTYTIVGFPLMVIGFDESGRDYAWSLGPFSLIGNALLWFYSTELFLYLWAKWAGFREASSDA